MRDSSKSPLLGIETQDLVIYTQNFSKGRYFISEILPIFA